MNMESGMVIAQNQVHSGDMLHPGILCSEIGTFQGEACQRKPDSQVNSAGFHVCIYDEYPHDFDQYLLHAKLS